MLALEFFPCSGGMAEGFRRAGIEFDMAFDNDPNACESYAKNLGYHRPIQMDVRDFLRMTQAGWHPVALNLESYGRPDLIVADPPCTPWSRAGKRLGEKDERDMLGVTCEIIRELQPRFWLIANVPGLDDRDHWKRVVQPVIGGLGKWGNWCIDYASLDAADYGVPQHRIRPFWFAHPRGTPCVRWPAPTHGDWSTRRMDGLTPYVTCRDALGHLDPKELGRPVRLRYRHTERSGNKPRASDPDQPAGVVTATKQNGDGNVLVVKVHPRHPVSNSEQPAFVVRTNGGRASGAGSIMEMSEHPLRPAMVGEAVSRAVTTQSGMGSNLAVAWPWDRPATTIQDDDRIAPPGHHPEEGSIMSMPGAVVLSEKAAAILQGFPETWHFAGDTKRARWSQIGQAMPPPLAAAVAASIKKCMESHETDGNRSVAARDRVGTVRRRGA